jgi:phospholipid-translocating ATPase
MQSISNRDEEVAKVNDLIEEELELIGSTAIEDKLQEGVSK